MGFKHAQFKKKKNKVKRNNAAKIIFNMKH